MIRDVDDALLALLGRAVATARVVLDPPSPADVHVAAGPAVHLSLRSVRPADAGRSGDLWTEVRGDDGRVVGRQPPVRRFRLVYRVRGCAADVLTAHALLDEVLLVCLAHDSIPADVLTPAMAATGLGVPISVTAPAAGDEVDDVLLLEVVAPVLPPVVTTLPTPVEELRLDATQVFADAESDVDDTAPGGPRRWSRVTVRERAVRPSEPRGA